MESAEISLPQQDTAKKIKASTPQDCLNRLQKIEISNEYTADTIARVKQRLSDEQTESKKYWNLETIDDFKLYHTIHPEWKNLSTSQIRETPLAGSPFYQAFAVFAKRQALIDIGIPEIELKSLSNINKKISGLPEDLKKSFEGKRKEYIAEIFPEKNKNWEEFTSIEDWIEEFDKHPGWAGLSVREIASKNVSGGSIFYDAFYKWTRKQSLIDIGIPVKELTQDAINKKISELPDDLKDQHEERREEYFSLIFSEKRKRWKTFVTIEQWMEEFNKHPGWAGFGTNQISNKNAPGGYGFYSSFSIWARKQSLIDIGIPEIKLISKTAIGKIVSELPKNLKKSFEERRKGYIAKIFPEKHKNWEDFVSLDQWVNEFNSHSEWRGLNSRQVRSRKKSGGQAFCAAFRHWTTKQTLIDIGISVEGLSQEAINKKATELKGDFKKNYEEKKKEYVKIIFPERINGLIVKTGDGLAEELGTPKYKPGKTEIVRTFNGIKQDLPEAFKNTEKSGAGSKKKEKVDGKLAMTIEEPEREKTTFVKGEALEQLFGLYLAYANPQELVLPQYCLITEVKDGKGKFGLRTDFKAGKEVYEVKWGMHLENILESVKKHTTALSRNNPQNLHYNLVRFIIDNKDTESLQQTGVNILKFDDLAGKVDDPEIREAVTILNTVLVESQDDIRNLNEVRFLRNFRNALYNLNDQANAKTGEDRKIFIREKLKLLSQKAQEGKGNDNNADNNCQFAELNKLLQQPEFNKIQFHNREAFFEWNGQIYHNYISIRELASEEPGRLLLHSMFGDIEFANEFDRNLAVMIELSDFKVRVEDCIERYAGNKVLKSPIFKLPNGQRYSSSYDVLKTNPDVVVIHSLEDTKAKLNLSDEDYNFGIQYIANEDNSLES